MVSINIKKVRINKIRKEKKKKRNIKKQKTMCYQKKLSHVSNFHVHVHLFTLILLKNLIQAIINQYVTNRVNI